MKNKQVRCENCKRYFWTTRPEKKYCSQECYREGTLKRLKMKRATSRNFSKYSVRNRNFTEDTPYLCQKWLKEGMSVREIADCLDRSITSVEMALKVPLHAMQKEKMKSFLMLKRRKS